MRASGYPKKAMYTMLISALANVILDPIFIFVLGLGIKGAAIATVISMSITTVWVLFHFSNQKHTVSFSRDGFKLKFRVVLSIISIGMSPFLINVTASAVNVFFNRTLLKHGGDLAIGAFGVINSFAMVLVMLIIGLCQGMQPIVGYNYGAGQYDRVKQAFKSTAIVATIIACVVFLFAVYLHETIVKSFTTDEELVKLSGHGLSLVLIAFPIVGLQIVTTNLFQSIGMAWKAILLSLSRQVLFLLPLVWIMPRFFDLNGVWIASPIADSIAAALAIILLVHQWRFFNKNITPVNTGEK